MASPKLAVAVATLCVVLAYPVASAESYACAWCDSYLEKNTACSQFEEVDPDLVHNVTCAEGCYSYAFHYEATESHHVNVTVKGCGTFSCDDVAAYIAQNTSYPNSTVLGCYTCEGDMCNLVSDDDSGGNVATLPACALLGAALAAVVFAR
ncbi:uncharacterized protein LOC132707790 [Cylas formicarius]|uniref:uncharacterized protein LOC132707790 n=1 Tax=Cylas formicarius TaxID=197179 RepID=UPI00295857A3|nr:uncharacterized protein LOC132707790 [Cylas formicarius]